VSAAGLLAAIAISPASAAPAPPYPPIEKFPRPPRPAWLPDLAISSFSAAPSALSVNGSVTYTIGVSNIGLIDASDVRVHWTGAWNVWFQGSISATHGLQCFVPAEYFDVSVRCVSGAIPAGQTATITITVRGPATAGTRSANVVADPYATLTELSESNNSAVTSVSFF
jgi:subtilase family serine protease